MRQLLLSLLVIFCGLQTIAQNTGIGVGTTNPDPSAQLDVSSTSKGFLPPRMTKAQRNAIVAPAAGLMVWCTDCSAGGELDMYNGTGWTSYKLTSIAPFGNVLICGQIWQGKNLDVSTYRNGDPIPKVTDAATWAALTTGAYCYYDNDSATYAATYGKLYNWYAVNDPRGLAPAGWHIPSDAEWTTLEACLGGIAVAGGAMKETGTGHWPAPNTGATNNSSFTGLPGGYRAYFGNFGSFGDAVYFWSSTEFSSSFAWLRSLGYGSSGLRMDFDSKQAGFSVRCLRD